jgi:uncharacterized protein YodC (DUF2158 family)
MANFKIGDVVKLKSGGPSMTVSSLESNGELWCVWFANNESKGTGFKPDMLEPVKKPEGQAQPGPTGSATPWS